MANDDKPTPGSIAWTDLTVDDAEGIRSFYEAVVGWESTAVDMGGYNDFTVMSPGNDDPVAGICHARKMNADLPAQWLNYIIVDDVDASIARCCELGGEVVAGPKGEEGSARACVIRDPAGAVVALYQPAE